MHFKSLESEISVNPIPGIFLRLQCSLRESNSSFKNPDVLNVERFMDLARFSKANINFPLFSSKDIGDPEIGTNFQNKRNIQNKRTPSSSSIHLSLRNSEFRKVCSNNLLFRFPYPDLSCIIIFEYTTSMLRVTRKRDKHADIEIITR